MPFDPRYPYRFSKKAADRLWTLIVRIKYPKLLLLATSITAAYFLFTVDAVSEFFHSLGELGYLSVFLGGMMFAFGFTAAFGVGLLATTADDVNIYMGAVIGGLGALLADYLLFKFVRVTFDDELEKIKETDTFVKIDGAVAKRLPPKIYQYLVLALAGMIIASPLPDEIGVMILAAAATVSKRTFVLLSFSLNTLGIFLIMELGAIF